MFFAPLPLAWVQELFSVIVIIVVIVRQVMTALSDQKNAEQGKEAAQREAARRAEQGDRPLELPPRQVVNDPAEPQRAEVGGRASFEDSQRERRRQDTTQPQDELRSEVEEFLKRINQSQRPPEPSGERPEFASEDPPRRRGPIDPFEEPPRRKPKQRPQPPRPRVTQREATVDSSIELLVDPDEAPQRPTGGAKRVELRHLPESQLAENAAHLGERIAGSDDRLEARLQKTFDHRLGQLGPDSHASGRKATDREASEMSTSTDPADGGSISTAVRLRKALATPSGVRDAVLMAEILRRPDERR